MASQQTLTNFETLKIVRDMMEAGSTEFGIEQFLLKKGFSLKQAEAIMTSAQTEDLSAKENTMEISKGKNNQEPNVLAEILSQVLVNGILYGVPVLLLIFGLGYVYGKMVEDLALGVRSLAAVILPLVVTLSFYKTQARQSVMVFFNQNRLVSFGVSFVMAFIATGTAAFLRQSGFQDMPLGELIFSATLALMVFGSDKNNEISFLHVGTVSGLLTYIIIFGV